MNLTCANNCRGNKGGTNFDTKHYDKWFYCPYCGSELKGRKGNGEVIEYSETGKLLDQKWAKETNAKYEQMKADLRERTKKHKENEKNYRYKCPCCDFISINSAGLRAHVRFKHSLIESEKLDDWRALERCRIQINNPGNRGLEQCK